MAGKVFINYRRDEAAGVAGRLYDLLSKEFDEQNVFMDVDSIQPGLDYIEQLDDQVANCGILLAVIGPRWVGATDATGQRRLDKPDDFVRVEIASALKRDIPVIPVLLDGARLPQESELPEDLKALTRRQAVELRHSHFAADSEVIVRSVRKVLPGRGLAYAGIAAAVAAFVLAGGAYWLLGPSGNSAVGPPPAQQKTVEQASPGGDRSFETTRPADGKADNTAWRSFTVQPTLDRIRPGETYKRPYLGTRFMDLRPELAAALGLSIQQGAIVDEAVPDTPAAAVGIEPGDIITAFNKKSVANRYDLLLSVSETRFGLKVPVNVWRMGSGADSFSKALAVAAERGNVVAMAELGVSYANGRGVKQDYSLARQWYEKAANLGDAQAMTNLALLYLNAQGVPPDSRAAGEWLEKAAAKSDPRAMYELGGRYRYGQGASRDAALARQWYQKAADSGHAGANLALGDLYRDGQGGERDYVKARELYEKAATAGDSTAMHRLGTLHSNGQGGPQNYDMARAWYEKAARLGVTMAMNDLGVMYWRGQGVAQDYAKAREWFEYTGSVHATAQSNLGVLYARGLGVKQDYDKAKTLFEQAAAKDEASAMAGLGDLYAAGNGVAKDEGKARLWYEKAAQKGNSNAMAQLGVLYLTGKGVAADATKAREWFEKGAEKGNSYSMAQLGFLHLNGQGVTADSAKAREWFEKSGDQAAGLFGLGLLYDRGQGVPMDATRARGLYSKAAELGSTSAMHNLALMEDKGRGGGIDPKAAARHELAAAKGGGEVARRQLAGDMESWSEATRSALQQELKASRLYSGAVDGKWSAECKRAAEAYYSSYSSATAPTTAVTEPKIPPAPLTDPEADERRDYQFAGLARSKKAWEDFIAKYPSGRYASLARDQLAKLNTPPVQPKPAETVLMPALPPPSPPLKPVARIDDPAIQGLDKAIQSRPNDANSYYMRGRLYAQHGDFARAINDFDEAIRLNPKDAAALNNRCWTHAVVGELRAALRDCEEALQMRPLDVDALDSRGFVKLKMGQLKDAISDYDAALRIRPNHASSLYGRGVAKIRIGNATGGNGDIAAAKLVQTNIVDEFARYGVR